MHASPIFLALECHGQDILQVFCKTFHVLAELDPPPGGELQGSGRAWLFKVVYVAPFEGDRPIGRRGLEGLQDQVTLSDPFRTQRENVVAFLPDPDPELHRLDRSGLPDEIAQMFKLFGGLELELIRIAALAQCRWLQAWNWHRSDLLFTALFSWLIHVKRGALHHP